MTTVRQALTHIPWHLIAIIGREHGLGVDSNLKKPDLIGKVTAKLLDPTSLNRLLPHLPSAEAESLTTLLLAGGRIPAHHLLQTYGPLRPPRQIIQAWRQQAALSPLEHLCVQGIIYLDTTVSINELYIPTDLIPLLPVPDSPDPPPPSSSPDISAPPIDQVCHDLAYLLALLHRDDLSPLHSRWLPPRFLAEWGRGCRIPPISPNARSERQTARRVFLHYLAENAGWLPASRTFLKPTPAAWLWLEAPRSRRLQTLRETWTSPRTDLWRSYRLPGYDWLTDPTALLTPLHHWLARLDPADPAQFAAAILTHQPDLIGLVPAKLSDPAEVLAQTVAELLTGPLVWLGVLWKACPERRRRDEGQKNWGEPEGTWEQTGRDLSASLRLTPQGLAWLAEQPFPDQDTPPAKFSIEANLQPDPFESSLTLTLADGLPEPIDLAIAIELGSKEYGIRPKENEDNYSPASYALRLTPSSFILALHRGWSPPALLDALNRLAAPPLTGPETALLRTWAKAANRMAIHPAVLLETPHPDIITRLAATRRGRALIHRTLSPRAVVVDPSRLEQLAHRLTVQEGVPPKMEAGSREYEVGSKQPSLTSYSLLLTACLVYQRLGQHIPLPARIPQTLLDHLADQATPADLAAADVAAEQTLAALQQTLDGYPAFPPWLDDALPETESLPIIEQALAEGCHLRLDYYAAGSNTRTHREVEPYRLEWRSDTPYLVGFCHLAQAERVFRVDRIYAVGKVPADSESDRDWG